MWFPTVRDYKNQLQNKMPEFERIDAIVEELQGRDDHLVHYLYEPDVVSIFVRFNNFVNLVNENYAAGRGSNGVQNVES